MISFTIHNKKNLITALDDYGVYKRYIIALTTLFSSEGNKYIIVDDEDSQEKINKRLKEIIIEDFFNADKPKEEYQNYIDSELAREGYGIIDTNCL